MRRMSPCALQAALDTAVLVKRTRAPTARSCPAAPRQRSAASAAWVPSAVFTVSSSPDPARPSLRLTADDTFSCQWDALQQNDTPTTDAGVETLYAFAVIDLYLAKSKYFGASADLGQFERFRRVLHSPKYRVLLSHVDRRVLSTLHVSEQECRQRIRVAGFRGQEGGEYTMTLQRACGGRTDGVWLTTRLECDAYWPTASQDPDGG